MTAERNLWDLHFASSPLAPGACRPRWVLTGQVRVRGAGAEHHSRNRCPGSWDVGTERGDRGVRDLILAHRPSVRVCSAAALVLPMACLSSDPSYPEPLRCLSLPRSAGRQGVNQVGRCAGSRTQDTEGPSGPAVISSASTIAQARWHASSWSHASAPVPSVSPRSSGCIQAQAPAPAAHGGSR